MQKIKNEKVGGIHRPFALLLENMRYPSQKITGSIVLSPAERKDTLSCVFPFCLWATKKIFWAVFRMNSNPYITVRF